MNVHETALQSKFSIYSVSAVFHLSELWSSKLYLFCTKTLLTIHCDSNLARTHEFINLGLAFE